MIRITLTCLAALLIFQNSIAMALPTMDLFLLPGQAAEETQGLAVNACTVANLQQEKVNLQDRINNSSQEQAVTLIKASSTQLSSQIQCVAYAKALNVRRFPAIVFDEKFVVYGMTNVAVALQVYCDQVGVPT